MLLLAIYTVLGAVPAVVSLTCPCQSHHRHGDLHISVSGCSCCHHAETLCTSHTQHFEKACTCGHNHSTDQALYILPMDGETLRSLQRLVADDLPEALAAEDFIANLDLPVTHERLRLGVGWGSEGACPQSFGLRAPPVWA